MIELDESYIKYIWKKELMFHMKK